MDMSLQGKCFPSQSCWPSIFDCANFARLFDRSFDSKQTMEDMHALIVQHGDFTMNGVDALMDGMILAARNGQGGEDGLVLAAGLQGHGVTGSTTQGHTR